MGTVLRFLVYLFIAICVIAMAIILGDYCSWYFAWLLGTVMIVLISAAGAALLDTQEQELRRGEQR
jgi:ABC-type transport system involved in cytochrome bd biosynthesis fused ATPase/permease subunit